MAKKTGKKPAKGKNRPAVKARAHGKKLPASSKSSSKTLKNTAGKGSNVSAAKSNPKISKTKVSKPKAVKSKAAKPKTSKPKTAAKSAPSPRFSAKAAATQSPKATGRSTATAKVVVKVKAKGKIPIPLPQPPALQPANGKPRKNAAGLSSREVEHFRDLLLAKRRELIGDMSSMEREALRSSGGTNLSNLPIHMADMGTDNYEQEFTLGLVQKDRDLLKEINLALAKLQNGTYGLCDATNLPINKERLEFLPWTRYSMEYQRKLERHGR